MQVDDVVKKATPSAILSTSPSTLQDSGEKIIYVRFPVAVVFQVPRVNYPIRLSLPKAMFEIPSTIRVSRSGLLPLLPASSQQQPARNSTHS